MTNVGKVGIRYRGNYSASDTYSKLDVVTYTPSAYICLRDNVHNIIPNDDGVNWKLFVKGAIISSSQELTDTIINLQSALTVNLLNPTLSSGTESGLTYVKNNDNSYTISGTNTSESAKNLILSQIASIGFESGKTYRVLGCPSDTPAGVYMMVGSQTRENGEGANFSYPVSSGQNIYISIAAGATIETPITIKPMITTNLMATYNDYVPYTGDSGRLNEDAVKIRTDIDEHSGIISANLMGIDAQRNLYEGSADWSGTWQDSDHRNRSLSAETLDGYPVMYYAQSWRKYYKLIPVVAGKTYTFEAWIKTAVAGTVAIYITDSASAISDPATVSQSVVSYQNTPANEWRKLSITFTCTASGNINPYVTSRAGAFYFTRYNLVEGESAFSLGDEINNRPTRNEISVGDYKRYGLSVTYTGGIYWNPIIEKNIPTRTKVKFVFDSYSGSKLEYVRVDGRKGDGTYTEGLCSINAPKWGDSAEFTTTEEYTALRIQFGRTEKEDNVSGSVYLQTNSEIGLSRDFMEVAKRHVYYVEKDGSGDFTSLVEAIKEATKCMDSVVYVGAGTWDIIDEFGETYMNAVSSNNSTWGLVLKNRVHLIGTAKTVIKAVNNSESTNFENIKTYFSVFNAGEKGFTLENINIEDENVRYSVHDDRGWSGAEPYTNRYIRCSMIHKNGKYSDCIGAGLGENQTVEIRGCYFEGDLGRSRLVYWHGNNNSQVTNALGKITVCDNYFAQDGTFMLTKYGQSNTDTVAYVSNNSFGTAPSVNSGSVAPYDNMRIVAWNNEIRN